MHRREIPDGLKAGTVDAGIIFATKTRNSLKEGIALEAVPLPPADSLINEVSYAIGVLTKARHKDAANSYVSFLQSDQGRTPMPSSASSRLRRRIWKSNRVPGARADRAPTRACRVQRQAYYFPLCHEPGDGYDASACCPAGAIVCAAAVADDGASVVAAKGKFANVKDDLVAAIEQRGLMVNTVSHVGDMLERTGRDLGKT